MKRLCHTLNKSDYIKMPILNFQILISDIKVSSSFLAFLQLNNCLSDTKIPVIDSVNNDVESTIDFGTA